MRRRVLAALVLPLSLACAGAAGAQMAPMGLAPPMNMATYGGDLSFQAPPSPQQRYNERLLALRDKTLRTTRADGGQLSPEHKAALQKELDALNRQFGVKPAG